MTISRSFQLSIGRRGLLAAAALLVTIGGAPKARADAALVDIAVVDRETGRTLPFWSRNGAPFVAGETGARYELHLRNLTSGRMLVVLTVDGVNVITGETAGYDQRGYVLAPYAAYDIIGWRKSSTEVADFVFAPLPNSYAARTGRPENVGVIGMAAFEEQPETGTIFLPPPPTQGGSDPAFRTGKGAAARRRSSVAEPPLPVPPVKAPVAEAPTPLQPAPPAPAAPPAPSSFGRAEFTARGAAPTSVEKLGTGHGAREWSVSNTVPFVRSTPYPLSVRRIAYDTASNLLAQGVRPPFTGYAGLGHAPRAFPLEPSSSGYAPDPPGER